MLKLSVWTSVTRKLSHAGPQYARYTGRVPTDAQNAIPELIQSAYYRWQHGRQGGEDISMALFASIYRWSATDAMRLTGKLSPQLQAIMQLTQFCMSDDPTSDHTECENRIAVLEAELATKPRRLL